MALNYTYKDDFIIDSVETEDVEAEEANAVIQADAIGVITEPYREKVITSIVYMQLSILQLEAEGMQEKYNAYEKIYNRYYSLSKTSNPSNISTIPIGRG